MSRPSIALCMIVRDEAAILPRCIATVAHLVDGWVICDTGSTDGTPDVVQALLGHLPGTLHRRPWKDFGHNRTELVELARGVADYLLLLDADHTVEQKADIGPLGADEYFVLQVEGVEHWLPRLIRADRQWRYVGCTHEYLDCDEPITSAYHHGLVVVHHGDGSSRDAKLERDRRLLQATLERTPDDSRATFYLAQTMEELGDTDAAIALYHKRIVLEGWDEEVHVARCRAAELIARDDLDAGIVPLLQAWEHRHRRREPLLALARFANAAERYYLTLLVTGGWEDVTPSEDHLFVDPAARSWGLAFERSIALARLGRVAEAIDLGDHIFEHMERPSWLEVDLLLNRQICCDYLEERGEPSPLHRPAPLLADLVGDECETVGIEIDADPPWRPLNPSIVADGTGFTVLVRAVNYERGSDGRYGIDDPAGVIRTRNFMLQHDQHGQRLSQYELIEPDAPFRHLSPVRGLEDLRLFRWRDSWHVVGTARDLDATARCRMVLARLDGQHLADLVPLDGQDPAVDEKNWMPFVSGDRLMFVYSCHPLVVLEWNPDQRVLREVVRSITPTSLASLRGGAPGVWVNDKLLLIGHECKQSGSRRIYLHRFLMLNSNFQLTSFSLPFSLQRYGVEFCAGMTTHGEDLLLSYGVEDRYARVMAVQAAKVLDTLQPV
jgi:glycosyltransferase involved in cell wall biosynthesis